MGDSKDLAGNIAKVLSGTLIAQIINIGATLIITRIYSTESYGAYSFFFSLSTFLGVISTGGFEYLIPKQLRNKEAFEIFIITILISLFGGAAILVVVGIIYLITDISTIFFLLPVGALFTSVFLALNLLFTHEKKFSALSYNKMGQAFWVNSFQIGLNYLIQSAGLIYGLIIGRFINSVVFLLRGFRIKREIDEPINRSSLTQQFHINKKAAFTITQSNVFSRGALEGPIILISAIFDEVLLGLYSLGYRVLTLPVSLIGSSLEQVMYKEVAERLHNQQMVTSLFYKNWLLLLALSIIPLAALYLFGEELFGFVFGPEWIESGSISKILAPMLVLNLLNASSGRSFILIGKQHISLYFSVVNFFLTIAAFVIGYLAFDFYLAIFMLVIFRSASILLYNIILVYFFKKHQASYEH